ncbi:unnamed protein product [Bemisia tabaci]|uniref:BTB domain-containing protein n=1 Tax=Bemisia tabaci TaxID=7038 RepID=A0A9P0A0R9_BEMTA|nr:unnamed protein product [Bemisia tabaci]
MSASPSAYPMPEFRDVDHYRNPLCIVDGGHEIVRPKPRRPGGTNSGSRESVPYVSSKTSSEPLLPKPATPNKLNGSSQALSSLAGSKETTSLSSSSLSTSHLSPAKPFAVTPVEIVSPLVPEKDAPEVTSPGPRDLTSPNRRDLTSPGRRDPTSPGRRDLPSPKSKLYQLNTGRSNSTTNIYNNSPSNLVSNGNPSPQRKASTPVSIKQMTSTTNSLSGGRKNALGSLLHHHPSVDELRLLQRRDYNGSSSDDNRSSGHASMSDGHTSSSPPVDKYQHYCCPLNSVPEDERLSASVMPNQNRSSRKPVQSRVRHRATPAKLVPCGSGLEDIKLAIQQLTMRSHTSNAGYSTSTYSSLSGSESSEPAVRRLMRHSSLETINTNVTSADEFVWVESHNRLVELQNLPWTNHDVLKVIQNGRVKESMDRVAMETIPRLSYLLQRALVRIARETQRLAKPIGMCGKHEVSSALRIILCPILSDSCIKACLRSAAMFAVSGDQLKQSKSSRAGLHLSVGKFHRWMVDVRLGKLVHEYAAVYMTAALENLLEEIILQCLPNKTDVVLTASMFEHSIANNGDLWGLLQPNAHLNTGRTASGTLTLPRWASVCSMNGETPPPTNFSKCSEQTLLTTCVGSIQELADLINRVSSFQLCSRTMTWSQQAIQALFYFMRCSQLEHPGPVQELVYERAYVVLPPLIEWVRTTTAHAEYRRSSVIDQDDVLQAARLLLPGVDCPIRPPGFDDGTNIRRPTKDPESIRRLKTSVAFKLLTTGFARDMITHAIQLLPATKLNTLNESGLSPLMLACINNDEQTVRYLLEFGCDIDLETPPPGSQGSSAVHPEHQHWTALTYAALQGNVVIVKLLLERGANVEGGAKLSEEKCTITPLQVAAASGNLEIISLLLSHGAHPFFSTLLKDPLCYSGAAQRGCFSAVSVSASHGLRSVLHKLLSHPLNSNIKEVLSLEEILAEGLNQLTNDRRAGIRLQGAGEGNCAQILKLSKAQIKSLQESMYHSAENNYLEITLDIRNLGIPWTLHCWMYTLATAHDHHLETMIDQLLQDFLQNEGTTLLLADIFQTCFGWEPIRRISDSILNGSARIDPKFVNNPELSDVQFRVEGRVFYAHKIVLVTASSRFRNMLSSKLCEGNPPIVQINDIRYHIFQLVMQFLYNGGCENLEVDNNDVLELMAVANFFQLDGLLRFCEAKCCDMVDLDNTVSMYIHAKVYHAFQLMEYCQGFLLQNMVALLTYDDSVKRLLFGKKLHNHDVLTGLLITLQARIKARNAVRPGPKPK